MAVPSIWGRRRSCLRSRGVRFSARELPPRDVCAFPRRRHGRLRSHARENITKPPQGAFLLETPGGNLGDGEKKRQAPSGRPCGGSIRLPREQGRLYKAFPFRAYSPGFRPGFLFGSPRRGFRLHSSVKSAGSFLDRARSRNRVPTGRIRFLSVYVGLKPYAEQSRPFGAWRFRAFGDEGVPAFVPAAYDFLRANFRRATSARSRGGDMDVSAPMRARTSQSPRKGRSF